MMMMTPLLVAAFATVAVCEAPLAATLMGVNAHSAQLPGVVDQLHKAGFTWIRDDWSWSTMEAKRGVYDFSSWEYATERIRANGMGIIAITSASNPLYAKEPLNVHSPDGFAAMAKWVAALAKHFANTQVWWEMTNEPNTIGDYHNASNYAELVNTVVPVIKAAQPNATVVGPASGNIGLASGWLLDIFEGGVLRHLDVVTLHPYRSDAPETAVSDLEQVIDRVAEYAPLHKTPMPVANGEWGYGSAVVGGTTEQARLFVRQQLITAATLGQPSIWYEACGPDTGEGAMGIMNCTNGGAPFTPLPAYDAAAVLHRVLRNDGSTPGAPVSPLRGFRFVRRLPIFQSSNLNSKDDWVLLFKSRAGDVLLVAWTIADFKHVLRIPGVEPGVCFSQMGMLGEALPEICHDNRGMHVYVTGSPLYLVQK